ncbi:MAG: DUF429 domain-containing protein [Burkholderiales bacterium]|nr:DUF429 domain-containing protein [Burkholderiales bacterium]
MDRPLLGVDFTSAPTRRKPITVARGRLRPDGLQLDALEALVDLGAFEALLAEPGPWFGAFDFPFGLPRAFVDAHRLGRDTDGVITELHRRCPTRMDLRALVDAWGNRRPPGQRLLHRATDTALPGVRSTSPLQTRYVPVGFMYYEGLARLVRAGVTIPRQRAGDPARVAVEAYPGLLAHELIGRRSYKNRDTAERRDARREIVAALEHADAPLRMAAVQRDAVVADAGGDLLDAVLCLVLAARVVARPGHGLPADVDPIEGWIVGP